LLLLLLLLQSPFNFSYQDLFLSLLQLHSITLRKTIYQNLLERWTIKKYYFHFLPTFYQKIQAMDEKCFKPKIFGIYRQILNSFILFVEQLTEIVLLSSTETIK
jgi:hypothetical protein